MAPISAPADRAEQTFTTLFEAHWSAVHSYARRRVATDADAHDIAAETFAIAWRRLEDIPTDHALPWLYRTAANVLANHGRSGRRRQRLHVRLATEPPGARIPEDEAVIEDATLRAAFSALAEDQRELLRLVAWEGLGHDDIGAVLGISTNAVASRVSRARARLAEGLATPGTGSGHERDDHHGSTP